MIRPSTFCVALPLLTLAAQLLFSQPVVSAGSISCDTIQDGYICDPQLSQRWGEYSPYFSLVSESSISDEIPAGCTVDFVQLLHRHGARFPTTKKTDDYNETITALQANVTSYTGIYRFLEDYTYNLGAENLTTFGEQELVNSGIKFYERYESLARDNVPFFRSDAEDRVYQSTLNFSQGYHEARLADPLANHKDGYPWPILQLSDATGYNNTLDPSTCYQYENGYESDTSTDAQATFAATFVPAITKRLESQLPGAVLTTTQTIYLMDLCPFETVASSTGQISDFCALFTEEEWDKYNYYQTLGKWYEDGPGNALGPTQGVGWVNELIARLTSTPVVPGAAVNTTLDHSTSTFPYNLPLFCDMSHDDTLSQIFAAMGLWNNTIPHELSNTTVSEAQALDGYSASWTVPFAARMYFERMTCVGSSEKLVRAIIDDRVVPLVGCNADHLGRCTQDNFIKSQSFSQGLGLWNECAE